jgi:hypothetical protein
MNNCPLCGAPQNWRDLLHAKSGQDAAWRPWEKRSYTAFGLAVEEIVAAGAEYERRRPVRDATLESDVAAPALQALITGVTAGACIGAVAAVAQWQRPGAIGLAAGTGVLSLTWWALLRDHRRLLWEIERVAGTDLNGDGHVGDPRHVDVHPEPRTTRVEITERRPGHTRMRFVDVPLSDRELERIAHAVFVQKENFSRRGLSDIISQEDYAATYNAMLEGGLIAHIGNSNELTAAGRNFLRQYLEN